MTITGYKNILRALLLKKLGNGLNEDVYIGYSLKINDTCIRDYEEYKILQKEIKNIKI